MNMIGAFLGVVLGAAIFALIDALIVVFATQWVAKFRPAYVQAYLVALFGLLASGLTRFTLAEISWRIGVDLQRVSLVAIIVVSFVAYLPLLRHFIRHPQTGVLPLGKTAWISLLELLMKSALTLVLLFIWMHVRD